MHGIDDNCMGRLLRPAVPTPVTVANYTAELRRLEPDDQSVSHVSVIRSS
jgi:hypothetical protein